MTTTIETDLKDILGEFKQEFAKINQRLDRIEGDLTNLKVSQAEIKGELTTVKTEIKGELGTLKTELTFIRDDVRDIRSGQRAQIWALIGIIFTAVISAVIKFGFFDKA